jgi:N-acetylneuraminate synthase
MTIIYLGDRPVGKGHPTYIIGEIGINHNGDLAIAKKLIAVAAEAGCDAVKFQKRTPDLCVPEHQRNVLRETPYGLMTYMEYRHKVEFGLKEYQEIDSYCREKGIHWFASCWDDKSLEFIERFKPPCHKIPSALLTDHQLLTAFAATGRPLILSTGMSNMEEIRHAVALMDKDKLLVAHCTSSYPCPLDQLNLRMIQTLEKEFQTVVGYSGHEVGLSTTFAAVVLGAAFVERHITLDRAMWGSDQAASVEPGGLRRLVENIRDIEVALGDGVKRVYDDEKTARRRLRVVSRQE